MDKVKVIMEKYQQDKKELSRLELKDEKFEEQIAEWTEKISKGEANNESMYKSTEKDVDEIYKDAWERKEEEVYDKETIKATIEIYEERRNDNKKQIEDKKSDIKSVKSDENLRIVTMAIGEIERDIKKSELELSKSKLALQEYYLQEDNNGKIPQDFYNEQTKIEQKIKKLEEQKNEYKEFLSEIKQIELTSEEYKKINQNTQEKDDTIQDTDAQEQEKDDVTQDTDSQEQGKDDATQDTDAQEQGKDDATQDTDAQEQGKDDETQDTDAQEQGKDDETLVAGTQGEGKDDTTPATGTQGQTSKALLENMKVNAHNKKIQYILENGDKKEETIDLGYLKKYYKKDKETKKYIDFYCNREGISGISKLLLKRKINPLILNAIDKYGEKAKDKDIERYFDVITQHTMENGDIINTLPFDIEYDLVGSELENKDFKTLNAMAKREQKIENVSAEGIKFNLWEKFTSWIGKGIKSLTAGKSVEKLEEGKTKEPTTTVEESRTKLGDREDIKVDKATQEKLSEVHQKAQEGTLNPQTSKEEKIEEEVK